MTAVTQRYSNPTGDHLRAIATHPQPCLCGKPAITTSHSHFSTERPACADCSRVLRMLSLVHHNVTVSLP